MSSPVKISNVFMGAALLCSISGIIVMLTSPRVVTCEDCVSFYNATDKYCHFVNNTNIVYRRECYNRYQNDWIGLILVVLALPLLFISIALNPPKKSNNVTIQPGGGV